MKEPIIIGASSFAGMLGKYLFLSGFGLVKAYVAEDWPIKSERLNGIPVLSFSTFRKWYQPDAVSLFLGIEATGTDKTGDLRMDTFELCKKWGYRLENYIHPTAAVSNDIKIGEGNNLFEAVTIGPGVRIGNANLFFSGSMAGGNAEIGNYNTFSEKSVLACGGKVDSHCFLGISSAVGAHVSLKKNVILGAVTCALEDMEAYSRAEAPLSSILEGKKSTDYL